MKKHILLSVLFAIGVMGASAQTVWKSDLSHSKVSFNVSHMVVAEVTGRFTEFEATLTQGKDDFSDAKISAAIKTKSINTDSEGRDKHLRSADFFDAEKYPEITFVSKSFEKSGNDRFKVTGDLTMHGTTKTIVLDTKFNGTINDPWGNTKAGFKAEGKLSRKEFGIVWNKAIETGGFVVGDEVEIVINVEMAKEKK